MAHLSGDEGLLRAFAEDRDIHQATAAEVFGADSAVVGAEQRRAAKAINFGLIYGMSAFGLARQLGIDRGAAQRYVDLYFQRYPGVRRYMEQTREAARVQGYVETVAGRRLYLQDIRARNPQLRQAAERSGNQCADAGHRRRHHQASHDRRSRLAATAKRCPRGSSCRCTTSSSSRCRTARCRRSRPGCANTCRAAAALRVPLKVDVGHGRNWDEAH